MVSFKTLLAFGASLFTIMVATKAAPTDTTAPAELRSSSAFLDLARRGSESMLECWRTCHSKALKDVISADEYQTDMNYCTQGLKPNTPFEALFAEQTCFRDFVDGYKKKNDLKAKFAKATEKAAFCKIQ
ncbi:hypothetical protein BGZ72_004773 [Mortierella alpina]|nr:hypothetical protein BGZ72_004773 [Mortierella alpina]